MLTFFRHIRRNLLQENRFSKYIIYAIGEIVLVVIGILIALQINTWNEASKQSKLSDKALSELLQEIKTTRLLVHKKNQINLEATQIMKRYLEDGYVNPNDSIKTRVVGYSFAYVPLRLSIPILEREISADNVITGEKDLLKMLQDFQNLRFVTNQQLVYLDNFWDRNLITFLKEKGLMLSFVSQAKKIDTSVTGLERLYDSEEFKDLVAMEYFHLQAYAEKVDDLEKQLQHIEQKLETILEEK